MTQDQLNGLLARVIGQAKQLNIPISSRIYPWVSVNHRAKTRFGCCRRDGPDFIIEVSAFLLEAEAPAIMQVLAHEVLHTCPGCYNHGPRWNAWAGQMNAAFGYAIRRTDEPSDLGLTDQRPVRWLVVCTGCGKQSPRMKRSRLVEYPQLYRCGHCGGRLEVHRVD